MTKLLFTHSYFLRFDPKQWSTGQPYAPIGTLYAASLMREHGFNVRFFDTMFAETPNIAGKYLQLHQPKYFIIYDDGFNYLTKMCLTNMRKAAFEMIALAKQNGCTVIVSGSDSTDRFEIYLEEGADYILLGEAEMTLLELVNVLENNSQDLISVQGLAFKQQQAVIKTQRRPVLKELDTIPFPAWDLIDMEPYRKMWLKNAGYFSMNLATTRGCPFKCNWCAKPIYGNRYNSRSPQNVIDELKMLKDRFQFDHIWFCDDIFGLKPGWVKEFADLVQQVDIKFRFKMQGRVDLLLEENMIRDLARAGCENIWMGAESGSQKILDAMDKGTTVQQIYMATRLLKDHNIHPSFFIQFGYPGEKKDDIERTIRMINDLLPHEIGISVSYPLPGTVFFEKVKADLKEKSNWTDSDELALMFRNTYQPAFYKTLHKYVHMNYRKYKAIETVKKAMKRRALFSLQTIKKAAAVLIYIPAALYYKLQLKQYQTNSNA